MKKEKIKAVVFDVGGVLSGAKSSLRKKHGQGVHEEISKKLKISLDFWFDSIDSAYADSIEGEINGEKAVRLIAKKLKISPEKLTKNVMNVYKKIMKRNNGLYKIAYSLKKKGYLIGILSDQWYLSKKALMPIKDTKPFDVVVVSCDVGLRKPNPKIYRLLIKRIKQKNKKIKPSEILFIDNRDWNLTSARKLGIKVILFKNNKQMIKEMKKFGVL